MKSLPLQPLARRLRLPALGLAALLAGGALLCAADAPPASKVKAPVVTKRVMPVHPLELQKQMKSGDAVIECVISETGALQEVKVLSATSPEFGQAAVDALKQWEFQPGEVDGHPTSVRLQIPFDFKLTMEQVIEAALKRPVFMEVKGVVIAAKELPAWPRPVQFFLPKYPESLKGSGKYGKAVVSLIINKEGKVINPTIVKATYPEFVLPAVATAARLEFPPQIMANGERIFVSMDVQFDFKQDDEKAPAKSKPKAHEKPKAS